MKPLKNILLKNEDWLMSRILNYAKQQGYSVYTSTLKEPWRLSISGLTASIIEGLRRYDTAPELNSEEDCTMDPLAQFGIAEAQRHRERGIDLGMFLGLMKYYRQSYLDLIKRQNFEMETEEKYELFINRVFDRMEIGFCVEWSRRDFNQDIYELQTNNRLMTNEKNKYLTIFESIPNPVITLNKDRKIDNMNFSAVALYKDNAVSGSQYYFLSEYMQPESERHSEQEKSSFDSSRFSGSTLKEMLPWIEKEIHDFFESESSSISFEKTVTTNGNHVIFRVKFSKNLDVSDKFEGIVIILEDITALKQALEEVKTLRGFVPICANCKKIRDDHGYWQQVEQYVQDHSEAQFSHSICPDCTKKLYGDLLKK